MSLPPSLDRVNGQNVVSFIPADTAEAKPASSKFAFSAHKLFQQLR